jgi:hypothetical protein
LHTGLGHALYQTDHGLFEDVGNYFCPELMHRS